MTSARRSARRCATGRRCSASISASSTTTGPIRVTGTFKNLPEGAAINNAGYTFRITYTGGDGNDVELTVAVTPSVAVSQGADTSVIGEPWRSAPRSPRDSGHPPER